MLIHYKNIWDKLSIGASVACAIHCVFLPLVFSTLPLFGVEIIENIWVEILAISTSLFIGGWAIYKGYKNHHKNLKIVLVYLIGILCILIGTFVQNESIEIIFKLIGAIFLVTAHIKNWYSCKVCFVCEQNTN